MDPLSIDGQALTHLLVKLVLTTGLIVLIARAAMAWAWSATRPEDEGRSDD